jgi:cell division protein FtsW (lipid II flippase)
MNSSRAPFLLSAAFPLAASLVVLASADVSKSLWLMHLSLIGAAVLLVVAGEFLVRRAHGLAPAHSIALLTLAGIAAPLFTTSSGPHRWIPLGPVSLYMAPLLLPSFFAACAVYLSKRGKLEASAYAALISASILLALQPDASQVLALLAGSAVLLRRYRSDVFRPTVTLAMIAAVTVWAFTRPDPLEPVPHVEGVFALALGRSLFAGVAVIGCAVIFIASLYAHARRHAAWLAAVAAYYSVLFGCSVAGLTPAPLIGYGAGPLLGYGLMAAVSSGVDSPNSAESATDDFPAKAS